MDDYTATQFWFWKNPQTSLSKDFKTPCLSVTKKDLGHLFEDLTIIYSD